MSTDKKQQRWIYQAEDFVREKLGGKKRLWIMDGPPHTLIDQMQYWTLEGGRTAILQIYNDGNGFDIFPNILLNGLDETAEVISRMAELEEDVGKQIIPRTPKVGNEVTMAEFFAEIVSIECTIEKSQPCDHGDSRDVYIDGTGREIGFISFWEGREPTHHLWSAGV